jgi:S-DNA-T family DNA segregation ATPase FtsK/SpoIIIE
MAGKKSAADFVPKARKGKPGKKQGKGFFSLLMSTPIRQIILVLIILIVLFWQWPNITAGFDRLLEFFGWGLYFIAAAIITLLVMIWRRKLSPLVRYLNIWLGGVALILAIWGIMGFIGEGVGGEFGLGITGYPRPEIIGILRILGLTVIGIFLIAPGVCLRLIVRFISWWRGQFKRKPIPKYLERQLPDSPSRVSQMRPSASEKPPLPLEMEKPIMPPEAGTAKTALEALEEEKALLSKTAPPRAPAPKKPAQTPSKQELRQVAQDVWKKYGQMPDLVTVNGWRLPPIDILDRAPEVEFSEADNMQRARLIEEALASYGVEAKVVQINSGPTVTQFGVEPGWDRKFKEIKEKDADGSVRKRHEEVSKTRVKVERITSLGNDLALALAAPSIRIEAPVPGKPVVGIEVPNTISNMVSLRGVVETSTFQKSVAKSRLTLALGKGAGGEAIAADLTKMPHLLIAGATGSGKTVCLNTIVACLLMHNSPNDVRFIMVDPKRVELTPYNSIPHLAVPVIVDTNKALNALRWLSKEMDQRYQKLASAGARNIEGFNKDKQAKDRMPYLVLIIDELADLMMAGFDEVETILCRLAQLARATGIHLVVATQRPSVDVVTGLIKANFPTRISFAVTSQVDSRTILDIGGAEKLLGKGDMLFMPTEAAKPKRLQGCFVSDAETERLVYFWNSQQQEEETDELEIKEITSQPAPASTKTHEKDPLLESALELAQQHENISTSFLQRRLHIGYPRAARLMEQVEEELNKEGGEGEAEQ